MRIVYDDVVYWLQQSGGITTYWNELTTRMAQLAQVTHVGLAGPSAMRASAGRAGGFAPLIWLRRYLRAQAGTGSSDVFHSSYYRRPCPRVIPSVVTLHDFAYERHREGLARMLHSWQKSRALREATMIICVSECTRQDAIRFVPGLDPSKLVVVHHGVSGAFHLLQPNSRRSDGPYVLFVGRRGGYKRFDLAVAAVQQLDDLTLRFTGSPPSPEERCVLDARLPGRWHHEPVDNVRRLNELYNAAWCLIYPSDHEGFGLPLLEAMRAGCPVVCAHRSSLPEVGGDAACYAHEQTAQAYGDCLRTLSSQGARQDRIEHGLLHAAAFNWDRCVRETRAVYQQAIDRAATERLNSASD